VSASEKLRALDKPLPPSVEPPGHKGYVLANALPQIVAVVEAHEAYWRAKDDTSWSATGGPGGRPQNWERRHDLGNAEEASRAALAALDEALS